MYENIKIYKSHQIKKKLKNRSLIFFFHNTNLNSYNKLKMDQKFYNDNIKLYKIHNNSFKIVLKKSIFSQFCILAKGSMSFAFYNHPKQFNNNFKNLTKFDSTLTLVSLKLNKKIYPLHQLDTLATLNYSNNICLMNKTFKKLLKKAFYVIKT